jgi:ribosome-associated protein
MDIKKLQALVVDALEDVKAQEIKVFDTTHLTSLFDRIAMASGTSNRQTKALAASVRDKVKEAGGHIVSIEGEETGEWVLVDLGDMIVHIMQPPIRAYYRLEEIWGEKEIKLGAAKRTASKRSASPSADEEEEKPKKRGRHLAANQASEAIEVTEPAPKARKPRVTKAKVDDDAAPAKAPRSRSTTTKTATGTKTTGTKITGTKAATGTKTSKTTKPAGSKAVGKKVKVASPKSAVASAKKAATKRPAAKKA